MTATGNLYLCRLRKYGGGTQNLMLKLIEEPPDHAYFIFTASGKSAFLPTILSRVIALGVSECSEQECREALADMDATPPSRLTRLFPASTGI
jgi:DNA polymerase-3 subunit delta'